MKALLRSLILALVVLDGLYFGATTFLLNTKLLQEVADMVDPERTQVQLRRAFSFFPGILWMEEAEIQIRDQNVNIQILAKNTWITFDLLPFREKRFHTRTMEIASARITIGMKSPDEKNEYLKLKTRPKDVDLNLKRKTAQEARKTHIKLEFPKFSIHKITSIETRFGTLRGDLSLAGGGRIQPGVEVEVFPSTLAVHHGSISEQLHEIDGEVHVHFDPFFIPDAPGGAFYQFVNADAHLNGSAESLKFLNILVRSLPHAKPFEGKANFEARLTIRKGKLIPESFLKTKPSRLILNSPPFHAEGTGFGIGYESDESNSPPHRCFLPKQGFNFEIGPENGTLRK